MKGLQKFLSKLLFHKNTKKIIYASYLLLGFLLYYNWNYLYETWFNVLINVKDNYSENIFIFFFIYYCYSSMTLIFLILYPLIIIEKTKDEIKIYLKNLTTRNTLKHTLWLIVFPIVSMIGLLAWIFFGFALLYVWQFVVLPLAIFALLFLLIFNKSN